MLLAPHGELEHALVCEIRKTSLRTHIAHGNIVEAQAPALDKTARLAGGIRELREMCERCYGKSRFELGALDLESWQTFGKCSLFERAPGGLGCSDRGLSIVAQGGGLGC